MAMEFVGTYQIAKLQADENVARVSNSETLAASVNSGLEQVRGQAEDHATSAVSSVQNSVTQVSGRVDEVETGLDGLRESVGIDRVIFSPYAYVPDNSISAVVDERHSALDLSDVTYDKLDYYQSSGFSWTSFASTSIFPNGQVSNGGSNRAIALWQGPGRFSDGEVLIRGSLTLPSGGLVGGGGAAIRGYMDNTAGYAAYIATRNGEPIFALGRYSMSSGTTSQTILTEVSIAFDVLDPYYIRFRADDTLLRAKIWTATEDEPSEWMLQASDSNYNSGYPGLIKVGGGAGNSRWSHLAVNAIGGRA